MSFPSRVPPAQAEQAAARSLFRWRFPCYPILAMPTWMRPAYCLSHKYEIQHRDSRHRGSGTSDLEKACRKMAHVCDPRKLGGTSSILAGEGWWNQGIPRRNDENIRQLECHRCLGKKTLLQIRRLVGNSALENTKSGAGFQFLLLGRMAKALK